MCYCTVQTVRCMPGCSESGGPNNWIVCRHWFNLQQEGVNTLQYNWIHYGTFKVRIRCLLNNRQERNRVRIVEWLYGSGLQTDVWSFQRGEVGWGEMGWDGMVSSGLCHAASNMFWLNSISSIDVTGEKRAQQSKAQQNRTERWKEGYKRRHGPEHRKGRGLLKGIFQ